MKQDISLRTLSGEWTEAELIAYAEERADGVQYITPNGVWFCPPTNFVRNEDLHLVVGRARIAALST